MCARARRPISTRAFCRSPAGFRCRPIRNLEQRVAEAHRRGAVAYIPSKAKKWDPNGPYQPLELRT
jgi:hypothetical protein